MEFIVLPSLIIGGLLYYRLLCFWADCARVRKADIRDDGVIDALDRIENGESLASIRKSVGR